MAPFPTRCELKCSACSFVISTLLLIIGSSFYPTDLSIYEVTSEQEVIELHDIFSSDQMRLQMQASCVTAWISFPFLLIALFGIKKLGLSIFENTSGEMVVFVMEKSYLMFMSIFTILIPALGLVVSAHEWSIHEYTPSAEFVATGYYIQMAFMKYLFELGDSVFVADATFMIALCLLPRLVLLDSFRKNANPKFKQFRAIMEPQFCHSKGACTKCCVELCTLSFIASLLIAFSVYLFQFAETGLFSPTGDNTYCIIWPFILKLLFGIRLYFFAKSEKYNHLKRVFDTSPNIDGDDDDEAVARNMLSAHNGNGYSFEKRGKYSLKTMQNANGDYDDDEEEERI